MDIAQTVVAKMITIKDVTLCNPARRKLPIARQYRVLFEVGSASRSTENAREQKNCTSWDNPFSFDGDDYSPLRVLVYQKHGFGKNSLVGTLNDTIGGALEKLKDGVLEDQLRNDTSDLTGITIRFSLAAEPRGNTDADVVTPAIEVGMPMGPPVAVKPLSSVVNAGTSLATDVQRVEIAHIWTVLMDRIECLNEIVAGIPEIHPYTSLACSVLSAAYQVLVKDKEHDDTIVRLAGTMSNIFTFVQDGEPLLAIKTRINILILLIQQVTECGYFITEYAKRKHFPTYTISDIEARIISGYENKLHDLETKSVAGVPVQSDITVVRMVDDVVRLDDESTNLNDMPYAFGARFQREKACFSGTRESLLREICNILNNPDEGAPRICLLTGVAGSGKSAVAHSIARLFDVQRRLGSSYCFSRSDIASRNPKNLFTTIARDLADRNPEFRSALWQVVKDDRALRTSQSPREQIERLIIEPYKRLHPVGPLVIVIDALDESGDQSSRRHLLDAISEHITNNTLPTHLRFFLTARPEADIIAALLPGPQIIHKQMGDTSEETVDQDIQRFIQKSLSLVSSELELHWPHQEWCRLLTRCSQHLFQWASTACNFIRDDASGLTLRERFEIMVQADNSLGIHPLDRLYELTLNQLFPLEHTRRRFQDVMAAVLSLREPLSILSLSSLLDGKLNIRDILRPLGSLLDGVVDEEKPIRILHTSFRDFLLDEARSSAFHVLPHSLHLGQALLACMQLQLQFNICDLKDPRSLNATIPDLPTRVNSAIPPHLAYSCQYWMSHLRHANCTQDLMNEVTNFFKERLPYWLEAISLLSYSSLSPILSALESCKILKEWAEDQETASLASEAFQFIQVFAPVLRESTPHLYLSAMPQTPTNSPLCKLWVQHLQQHVSTTSGHLSSWPAEVLTLHGHTSWISSVAYSPNGTHIVSGSEDNTVRVWNAITGQCVAGPFLGHTASVWSVAYSPDGTCIVSGSRDSTIMVWNATTGMCVAGPFQGHVSSVFSVAYSPDGTHIVSGSRDKTIRIWNATTGQPVASFQGHTSSVLSVTYSPNGCYIASGSDDNSVMVWDAITGQSVAAPFQGHTSSVFSIAYSPGGTHIVSGSEDRTIRIWDGTTGQCVAGPFEGHTSSVFSVAYSPDDAHTVSGSKDNTIRVWDATTGQCIADPFEGHTSSVRSAAYSPDGHYLVSGSEDKSIRVWAVTTSQHVEGPSQGHTSWVFSLAYSPDGTCIASGSKDNTIRVLNAVTGELMAGPFLGHTSSVLSVAYSPDSCHIASGSDDSTVMVWDASTGQHVTGPLKGHTSSVFTVAYSPDSIYIASGSRDKTVRVWNATTGQGVGDPFQGHKSWVSSVAYSPDGRYIISGSRDKTIRVWDAITGQCVGAPFEGHKSSILSVACSPNGAYIVSGSGDNTIRIWDLGTGECVRDSLKGHKSPVSSVTYSPDCKYIVSGSADNTIRVWDATSGVCVAGPFQGHMDSVSSVAYSPGGDHIVTGSYDSSIKVWKVQELLSFVDLHEEENGWIQSSDGSCFGWIAPWNRNHIHLPIHSLIISPGRVSKVNIDSSLFGDSWISCWK